MASVDDQFDALIAEVRACQKCARMVDSARVLDRAAGPLHASVMFIGEAPGRLGADTSGIPFHGDKAGDNFERLLATVGLDRYSTFITNAALCNPKDEFGNNSPPTGSEIANCAGFLKRQIDLVNPLIVVTLGAKALEAVKHISSHELTLASAVRRAVRWYQRDLVPLYHPGQRAMIHRSYPNQLGDYYYVAELLKRRRTRHQGTKTELKPDTYQVVRKIFQFAPKMSYFALHKIFYLVEYDAVRKRGSRLTNSYIIRQKDGPYCVDLHIRKIRKSFPEIRVGVRDGVLELDLTSVAQSDLFTRGENGPTEFESDAIVENVVTKYAHLGESRLKTIVYMTQPMRRILREELRNGRNMLNAPLFFDKTG